MEIRIRPVRPEEHAELGRLTVDGYRADGFLNDRDGTEHYAAELADTGSRDGAATVLVAVAESGELLGTVTWCPPGSDLQEVATRPDQGEFRMLAVSPTARRRGVARALTEHCLELAGQNGLTEIVLSSLPTMTAAHGLYASLGFERAPELDWSPAPRVWLWGFRLSSARRPAPDR